MVKFEFWGIYYTEDKFQMTTGHWYKTKDKIVNQSLKICWHNAMEQYKLAIIAQISDLKEGFLRANNSTTLNYFEIGTFNWNKTKSTYSLQYFIFCLC